MRAALVQLTASDDPSETLPRTLDLVRRAEGADLIVTPEVTNCVSASRTRQREMLRAEADDPTLAALRGEAARQGAWILVGSLALQAEGQGAAPFVNRSFLISPEGAIAARYDKIHMFDVELGGAETYRESAGYRAGDRAVLARAGAAAIGMTVCYDLRFPALYRTLAKAGATVLTVPSAFSPVTGPAHWETLLRARAIETGAYVLAPAQCGAHAAARGRARSSHGRSLAVSPWGEVLADMGEDPGATTVDLDLGAVAAARRRIPSLAHDRPWTGP